VRKNTLKIVLIGIGVCMCVGLYFGYQYLWKAADQHFKRAEYQQVFKLIKYVPKPQNVERLRIYSQTFMALGEYDKARKGYEKLFDKTKDPAYRLIVGNILNQQEDYVGAIKVYEEVISLNPNYVQVYVNLSTIYRIKGNNDKAVEIAERGIGSNGNSIILYELLVSLMQEKKDSPRYNEAVNKLKLLDPQNILLKQIGEVK